MNFKKVYKKPPPIFGNTKIIKRNLERELQEGRRKRRTQNFEENRMKKGLSRSTTQKDDERSKKLLEWRAEQKRKKEAAKLQKKPPFKVGIVRHNIYSPVADIRVSVTTKGKHVMQADTKPIIKKGITKATEKRLLAKAAEEVRQKTSTKCDKSEPGDTDKSFAPINHKFKPPAGLPRVSLFGTELIENNLPHENTARDRSANYIDANVRESFYSSSIESITLEVSSDEQETSDCSRGEHPIHHPTEKSAFSSDNVKAPPLEISSLLPSSDAKRKDSAGDLSISLAVHSSGIAEDHARGDKPDEADPGQASPSDEPLSEDTIARTTNISSEKHIALKCFKRLLRTERKRLRKLCEEWTAIQSQDDITEDIRCRINQAIGQTTLLIEKKFRQFHNLMLNCEEDRVDLPITCTDLHGFWDMTYIEVKDCVSRFANLERLRAARWQEKSPIVKSSIKPVSKTMAISKKRVIPMVQAEQNTLRTIISAERKKTANIQDCRKVLRWSTSEYVTPSQSTKEAARENLNPMYNNEFIEGCAIGMHTSTPIDRGIESMRFNKLSTPLITIKVNQLYNKSAMHLNNDTVSRMNYDETPTRSVLERLRKPRRKNFRRKPACKIDSDGCTLSTESLDEKSEVERGFSGISSQKVGDFNVNEPSSSESVWTEDNPDMSSEITVSSSVQTVIETTLRTEEKKEDDTPQLCPRILI